MALRWIGLAAAIVLLLVIANVAKSIYVDFLWFDSVGFEGNFQRVLIARVVLFAIGAVLTALVLGVNIWLARRLAPEGVEESFIEDVDPEAIRRVVTVLLIAMTIFLALVFGAVTAGSWETILTWLNAVDFGVEDSQFNRDISFYLFDLPAYHFIQGWVLSLLVVSTLGAGAVYGLTFSLQRFELNLTRGMKIHVSVLAGLILLVIAFETWLSVFDLATSPGGIVAGATYADVNARIPARYVLVALGAFAGLATNRERHPQQRLARARLRDRAVGHRGHRRRLHLPLFHPVVPGRPERAREGRALHRPQHRGHSPRVGPRSDRRDELRR